MNELIAFIDVVLTPSCIFIFALCVLRIVIFHRVSHKKSQCARINEPVTSKPYYICYCKDGRKDRVIHILEVSRKTFENVTAYHDMGEIIHIGMNKVYLDASVSGSSFSRLADIR